MRDMATAQNLLVVAASQLGVTETPVNRQRYSAELGRPAESWCADFCEWALKQAGVPGPGRNTYGNASTLVNSFGNIHIAPQPGDLVGYHFPGESAGINHVGIVESVDLAHGTITSIEGNTTPGIAGVQSNGGGVYRRTRPMSQVVGFGRPAYTAPTKEAPVPDAMPDYPVNAAPIGITCAFDSAGNVTGYAVLCADGGMITFGRFPYLGRVHKSS